MGEQLMRIAMQFCRFAKLLSAVMTTIVAATPLIASETPTNNFSSKVDHLLAKWDRKDSPGIAVGIVRGGKLVHSKGYGMANLDHAILIDATTVFELGSVTKSFTTACFALLLDDGNVKLDDDVRKYIPELSKVDPPIKVRHLLRCESGYRDYYISLQFAGWNVLDAWTKEDVLQLIAAQKRFEFQPGKRFAYSNSDFFLIALIVERVTGKSLADFAKKRLFRPLKMNRTYYATDPTIVVRKRATGYQRKWRTGKYHKFELRSGTIGPFGLKTTIEDLYRWDQNCYDNKLTAGPHFKEFLKTGCLIGNRNCLESFPESAYRGADRYWYTGGIPGAMAQFIRYPKHNFAIILLSNISERAVWIEMTENAKRIADLYLADQLDPKPQELPRSKPAVVSVPVGELRKLTGSYRRTDGMEEGFLAKVSVQKTRLVFTDHFGRKTPLAAISSTQFRPSESESDQTFDFSFNDGERSSLTIKTGSNSKKRYEAIAVAKPTKKQLAAYVGRFYSPELLTTYFITVKNDRLFLRINNRRKEELAPTILDEFVPRDRPTTDEGRVFQFSQNDGGKAKRLRVRLWRGDAVFESVGHQGIGND
jgi:CubicO group peptidase (beta-lactamase class C family)